MSGKIKYKHMFASDGTELKRCSICGVYKPIELFTKGKQYWDGLKTWCRPCCALKEQQYLGSRILRTWTIQTVSNHKKRGIEVLFKPKELEKFIVEGDQKCYICGKELNWDARHGRGPKVNTPTMDIKDNIKSIQIKDIALCCHDCNTTKGARTIQQFEEYLIAILIRKGYEVKKCTPYG